MWQGPMQGHWGLGWGMVMGLFMLLFVALVVAGIIFLVWFLIASARGGRPEPASTGGEKPLDILKQRYARGEITPEQFQQMKRDLEA